MVIRTQLSEDVGESLHNLASSKAQAAGDLLAKQADTLEALTVNRVLQEELEAISMAYPHEATPFAIQARLQALDQQWLVAREDDPLIQNIRSNEISAELLRFRNTDLSKIEAGKMELNMEEVDLQQALKVVMSTAIGLLKDKPVTIEQEIPAELPEIWADNTQVRQILLNLVSNAAKFTEAGTILLKAGYNADWVTVSVADTGLGIPQDKKEALFSPLESPLDSAWSYPTK
jgi:signal transduction histidine kinase